MAGTKYVAGYCLFDFFRELPVVYGKLAQYIETNQLSVQQLEEVSSVKEWQKMLVTLSLLAKKYKDLFSRYLCHLKYSKATAQRFGWMLYLVLKSKLLPRFPDLVSLMVAHSNKLPHGMPLATDNVLDTLTVISDGLKTNTDQVFRLQMSVNTLVSQLLSDCLKGSSQENVDLPTLPGLLSDHEATSSAMSLLEREYDAVYSHQGELDERDFLATDMARFASPRMSPATAYNSSTPLHQTMGSAAWLRSVTQPLPLGPSATLKGLLAACQPDPSPVIAGRIAEMVGLVLPDEQPAQLLAFPVIHQTAAQERRAEATKLYYLVLERVITEECKRTGHTQLARPSSAVVPPQCQDAPTELSAEGNIQSDLTAAARVAYCALLNSTNFHKGLVACCLEVVIASYR
ncbi:hypothetical protein QJQ45_006425 [Haematococcus lacustris]|nr:hypothetical protein QJQ45_006425 [Haematococcus lacustris]